MKILTKWLRSYLPGLPVDDARLAEDLTLRGIAVEGIYDLGEGNGPEKEEQDGDRDNPAQDGPNLLAHRPSTIA